MNIVTEGFKKTILIAYILAGLGQICSLLFYFILFKFLLVEAVGLFSWAMAIAVFFAFFLDLGLNQTLIRGFSQSQLNLKSVIIGSLIIRLPIILLAMLAFQGWHLYLNPSTEQYLALFLVGMMQILIIGERICQSWLRANEKQIIANIITVLGSIGRLGVAFTLIYWWRILSVTYIFASILFIHVVILLIASRITYFAYHRMPFVNSLSCLSVKSTIRSLWKPSLIFGLMGFFTVIQNRLDWIMVSGFISKVELANYSLANKIYEIFLMFIAISLTTAYPWMCKDNLSQDFKLKLNVFLNFIIFLGVTVFLVAALYMPKVLQLLWGAKYELANPMIQLLMFGAAFAVIAGVFYHLLISRRLERKILPIMFIATVFQVVTNFFLIPRIGGFGATIAMLVLIAVTSAGLFWIVHKEQIITFAQLKRLLAFLTIISLLAGIFWIADTSMALGVFTLFVLGIAGMYFILSTSTERKLLMNLVSNYFPLKGSG